jgi:hypothetical protein
MAYIIKNTSALINTRLTDVGRRYLSQGNFNISYFQVGDSEVNYTAVPNYNQVNNNILMPAFNSQNDTGSPQSNKQYVKYPYYLQGSNGITYGIPYMDSQVQPVYNSAGIKGFFTSGTPEIQTGTAYTITSNYVVELATLAGGTQKNMTLIYDPGSCVTQTGTPSVGDFLTLVAAPSDCGIFGNNAFLTFKIQEVTDLGGSYDVVLDRAVPNYTTNGAGVYSRTYIYPSGMTVLYDFITPEPFWEVDTLNFESPCDVTNRENTLIWNMNIPWSESPAGVFNSTYEDYEEYGSVTYIGTKEYLGYQENSGQTFWNGSSQISAITDTFYYNSFDEKINVEPKEQKAIAIIHYTNQDIDNVYGEKFSTIPYDPQNPTDDIGLARHFKFTIPNLMWHKSSTATIGQTFYIDPPSYELCQPYYIKSTKNIDMNDPGIRYFHLWDTNPDTNQNLNRIGKVFPDQQIIVIDDEEVIAALSYKANRNWTLPAPKITLITPNICNSEGGSIQGILTSETQVMWVTYRLDSEDGVTTSLHCNYYSKINGPSTGCTDTSQNVAIRFGNEFPFMNTDSDLLGFKSNTFKLIFQLVNGNSRPNPTEWLEYDFTSGLTIDNGYITVASLTSTTFIIDQDVLGNATPYQLQNYLDIPQLNDTEIMNFGDEYYFYGNIETDISATIYEMRYLVNLGRNQFTDTSNPTWTKGTQSYVTEIGLYNSNKDLMVISKLQSPELRQGIQQYVVKLDF